MEGQFSIGTNEVRIPFGKEELVLGTGKVARQASGAVLAKVGDTVVLASVVMSPTPSTMDFFPLMVDYREKAYAAGRVPGGYFKREGRPGEAEILRARLIDRPLRPLFPEGFRNEVQVYINILSFDGKNSADTAALTAASTALIISEIPFTTPVGAVRVGFDGTNYILNPSMEEQKTSQLDLIVAGTAQAITMVESGAKMLTEEQMLEGLRFGHAAVVKLCEAQEKLRAEVGKEKATFAMPDHNTTLLEKIRQLSQPKFVKINEIYEKKERSDALDQARDELIDSLTEEYPDVKEVMKSVFEDEYSRSMREKVLSDGVRADGRKLDEIRPITVEVGVLPMPHGAALFTRGQTQSLGVLTLGTGEDTQEIDDLEEVGERTFYMHYNFPSFSVGEVRPVRGPGRREIGHGALAERSIAPIVPDHDKFPYTLRVVSEILESNGSSSMASVCSGCLAMMDGGVPIKAPVAGIAMGLIKEGDRFAVLSDIMGLEDHLGDMDFKVAGTRDGITALQMDIKIQGITFEIMEKALQQAKAGRQHILDKMVAVMPEPRADLKPHAPRIEMITINPERIKDVIGTGGKIIKEIVAKTGAKIDINDSGQVFIASADGEAMARAIKWIRDLTTDAEIGQIYTGRVTRIADFGAFAEIMPGKEGLVHVSELEPHRVERVEDVCRLGDEILVKVIGIDEKGKIRLSRKQALHPTAKTEEGEEPFRPERGSGRPHDRGGRGGDRGGRGGDRGGRGGDRGGRGGSGGGERGGRGRRGGHDAPRGGGEGGHRHDRQGSGGPAPLGPRGGSHETGGTEPGHESSEPKHDPTEVYNRYDNDNDQRGNEAPGKTWSEGVEDELGNN